MFLCLPAVYNLTNNIDVENTKLRMEQYQKENKDIIQRNKAKLVCTFKLISYLSSKINTGFLVLASCPLQQAGLWRQ